MAISHGEPCECHKHPPGWSPWPVVTPTPNAPAPVEAPHGAKTLMD